MKMTSKEIIEVIKGFNNGKEIQFHDLSNWRKTNCDTLDSLMAHIIHTDEVYRVKPEDKYRPYKTIDEAMELMGKIIKRKDYDDNSEIFIVHDIYYDKEYDEIFINSESSIDIFNIYEYYDKSMKHIPLGVKE